jgi:hypothetical protein
MYPKVGNLLKQYRLRWRYEFINGTFRYGMWDQTLENYPATQASKNLIAPLLYAVIEGEHFISQKIIRLYECSGQDFCNFQWQAICGLPVGGAMGALQSHTIGMIIISRDFKTTVFCDGKISVVNRTEQEKNTNFEIYGK